MIAGVAISESELLVLQYLDAARIGYARREHPAVFTVEQAQLYDQDLPGAHCKNLFLRDKKGRRYFLAIFAAESALDLKTLGERMGVGGLSFASPERLREMLGVEPGAVGPLALIHDSASAVEVWVEAGLRGASYVGFHPNVNTTTLTIPMRDFECYLALLPNPVRWI
jgi:Ala-tRNA(Pro) deacylase